MRKIRFENVTKSYDNEIIIDNLTLDIPAGKFFALLGPSGCGKTTLLRLMAGLELVDSGRIYLGDQDITNLPIHKRKINTVFQQYALFPHLSVFENVAYSLRLKGLKESDVCERIYTILKTVRLLGHEAKSPQSLSGGQQQRVALARAIVNEPEVLLLDEPLASLDLKLKEQMLIELIDLQERFETTFVYVTHDQTEALTVADTMAIMNVNGKIEQIDTPKRIYEFPRTRFVASFVGNTNIIEGILRKNEHSIKLEVRDLDTFEVFAPQEEAWMEDGTMTVMSLRPEKIFIYKSTVDGFANHMVGTVKDIIYYGSSSLYRVQLDNGMVVRVFEQNEEHFPKEHIDYDDEVNLYFQKENVVLLEG
jgi:spermidine/putrescine transport system ATP-binding protein